MANVNAELAVHLANIEAELKRMEEELKRMEAVLRAENESVGEEATFGARWEELSANLWKLYVMRKRFRKFQMAIKSV